MSGRTVAPDRVRWSVDLLDPGSADTILEIGSGPGVAATAVCKRLTTGKLLAVDRSAVATRRTAERNTEHVDAGRLEVRTVSLDALDVPESSLDAAFSINVNLFWTRSPGLELHLLRTALRPGGTLLICYGSTAGQTSDRVTKPITETLAEHGFVDVVVRSSTAGVAVVSCTPA